MTQKSEQPDLIAFMNGPHRNLWITQEHVSAYLRKGNRYYGTKAIKCLELASINIPKEQQGRGLMTAFIKELEKTAGEFAFPGVFIESILNGTVENYCQRNGYLQHGGGISPCYIKLLT